MAAAASTTTSRRFAAACGALGQYVKAAELARQAAVPVRPLPLMPGADVPDDQEQREAAPAPAPAQLTIVYGGRVLVVLDDVTADKAANLLRTAASAARGGATVETQELSGAAAADLLPVARKASLQRFMEKRRCRAAAARTAPYRRPDGTDGGACREDHLKLAL